MRAILALSLTVLLGGPALAQQPRAPVTVTANAFTGATVLAQNDVKPAQQTQTTAQPATKTQGGLGFGSHDSSAPVNIAADNFLGDLGTKVGTYSGNVVVVQGDMTMRSDRVRIEEVGDKPSKIYGHGNVVIVAPNGTATGDDGVYDLDVHTITLTGKVVLTKEKNVMRGTKLVMDMTTNLAHLTAQGMEGGRVKAVFTPKQDQGNGGAKKPAPNGGK